MPWLLLAALAAVPREARAAVRQVLVLQSYDRGYLVLDTFTNNFRAGLDQSAAPINVVQVVVGPTGFVGASEAAVVEYARSLYSGRPAPDLIVSVGGPAAAFARNHRAQLFPEVPVLFASLDQRFLLGAPLGENETAVAVANDFPRLVDDIVALLPDTRRVVMITGSGPHGIYWRRELENGFARFDDRLTFQWTDELSFAEIVRLCASLPEHSVIFFLMFGTDAEGGAYADEQVLSEIHAKANAPLFGALTPLLGHGIVGGTMVSIDDLGHSTAETANRLLAGAPATSVRVPPRQPGKPIFDGRELRRWNIPESRLPAGSIVRYGPPALWDQYRRTVLTTVGVLVVQSLLIAWLLYERRARRRAEIANRRNLGLAADANRRATMSALTSSIGHELGQPLSSMMYNLHTLQGMVTTGQLDAAAVGELVAETQSEGALAVQIIARHRAMLRSRELERRPTELRGVVEESLALLAHDLQTRRIAVTVEAAREPCLIAGDQVLLQQVLVNLVKNAMDALAEVPPSWRRITIRSAVSGGAVELSVTDSGKGLPAEVLANLFTPFVTTKPHGLGIGLIIVRSIVEAHGGKIVARQDPGCGATFTITLPHLAAAYLPAVSAAGSS